MLLWKHSLSNASGYGLNLGLIFIQICLFHAFFAHAMAIEQESVGTARPSTDSGSSADEGGKHLLCTPFGTCEPCPSDAMNEPFCQPFGNRRLMHCLNTTIKSNKPLSSSQDPGATQPIPEILAWESCGRIPAKERADFYEFVACNVIFALVALGVLVFRERRLRIGRAMMLAARIGIGGGAGTIRR